MRCAGARERVCLPFGRHVRGAVRVHVSGCAYHLAACVQRSAGARERVRLPFGSVRSALRVHVSGRAYHLAGVCGALRGRM